jgi:hypothetical protein
LGWNFLSKVIFRSNLGDLNWEADANWVLIVLKDCEVKWDEVNSDHIKNWVSQNERKPNNGNTTLLERWNIEKSWK